jgi:hypothetical protein
MKTIAWKTASLGLFAAALLLAACGGGGGGEPSAGIDPARPGTDVPSSASATSAGAMAFAKSVAASSTDSAEPITVGDAVLASSDTDEPETGI